jgi:hypothetical protein
MYYMIHATDHPEAPRLMSRAYRQMVYPLEPLEQLSLELELGSAPLADPCLPLVNAQRIA